MVDCAKCGRKFFQHSPVNALWCDKDHVFLCRKCTKPDAPKQPRVCSFCSGRVSAALSGGFALAIFLIALGLALGTLLYFDAEYRSSLQSTPEVPVSSIHPGEVVRLYGVISSSQDPVLSAYWQSSGKGGGSWVWSGHDFYLNQGSGTVLVDVSNMMSHIYGNPPHSSSNQASYQSGDTIAVVGTVDTSGGSLILHAQAASASDGGFGDPAALPVAIGFYIMATAGVVVAIYSYVKAVGRVRDHEKRVRQPGMYDYRLPDGRPSSSP
jgi:hypothetical protein